MPRGDGTGPMGFGPMTGRAAGYCAGYSVPGYMNPIPGGAFRGIVPAAGNPYVGYGAPGPYASPYGYAPAANSYAPAAYGYGPGYGWGFGRGAGWGRGFGFGRGRGRGFGRGWW